MADLQQREQLSLGVKSWNQWRRDHPEIPQPDLCDIVLRSIYLSGADLSHADFSGADLSAADLSTADLHNAILSKSILSSAYLSGANLHRATLSGATLNIADLSIANLSGADLRNALLINADLSHADLSHAILSGANLSGANLSGADLNGADLSDADLSKATLIETDLSGTNLSRTRLSSTIFANVGLHLAKGLVEIYHSGPSIVELHSIQLPQDGSAIHFLQGVGVPDAWIDFYTSMMIFPIQYYSCFLSYSSADDFIVKRLHADLQANGVRCWFAPHDLKPGNYIRKEIDQAIHLQDKLLLILSESAMKSGWVGHEVEIALAREIRQKREILFPIRLDEAIWQTQEDWAQALKETRHIGDFTNWTDPLTYQKIFGRLLLDLKHAETL